MEILLAMLLILLALVGGLVFFWLLPLKMVARLAHRHGHSAPCPSSLAWLVNNPIRRRYMRPLLDRVGIRPGERVLELGPGPGTFTVDAARRAGRAAHRGGHSAGDDCRIGQACAGSGLSNVEARVASAYELPLDNASVDRAFLVTVLPEILDQERALAELRRVLKPGGVLSITEEFSDPDYPFLFETVRRVEAAGFRLERRMGNWWVYTVNFCKA